MKKLLSYLKKYKKECFLAPLFKLLEATFELFVPLVIASIIDKGIVDSDKSYVVIMGGVLLLLAIVGLVAALVAQFFAAKAATGFAADLKNALFSHIQKIKVDDINKFGTSTLITRMTNDVSQVQSGVNLFLRLFLRSPFIVLGAMVMAFFVDVKGGLVFLVVIPVLSIIVFGIMLITTPMYKKVQESLDKVLTRTRDNLKGVRVLRAFCRQKSEKEKYEQNNDELYGLSMKVGMIASTSNPLTFLVVNAGLIALVWIGGVRVNIGDLTQGQVVALVNYMSQILVELYKLANLIVSTNKAIACGNRIQEIFESGEVESLDGLDPYDTIAHNFIEAKNVSFTYEGSPEEMLSDISFEVKKGEVVGIIGGTGSGKTTLINLLQGYYKISKGKLLINGKNINKCSKKILREHLGLVPQKSVMFSGTIRENMNISKKGVSDEEIIHALDMANAKEFVFEKEDKLDENINMGGTNFSGGQRQRLAIARALVKDADMLIFDDSFSALDYATEKKVRTNIYNEKDDKTIFIVSQRCSSVIKADKMIVLDDGKMVGYGKHEYLLDNCEEYREIYQSQYGEGGVAS